MPAFLALVPLRYWIYLASVVALCAGLLALRQHYVNAGWDRALETVKAQDATAKEAASRAQGSVDRCYDTGGTWSVITGNCTLEAKP